MPRNPRPYAAALRRMGWGGADQVLSSATNFALISAAARLVGSSEFGEFALVYAIYILLVQVGQALFGEPMLIMEKLHGRPLRVVASAAASCCFLVSAVFALPALVIALAFVRSSQVWLVSFASCLIPFLLLQDCLRLVAISLGQPRKAFILDLLWGVGQAVGFLLLLALPQHAGAPGVLLAWGAAGALSGLVGLKLLGIGLSLPAAREWGGLSRRVSRVYLVETVALAASTQGIAILVGLTTGVAAAGGFRIAQTLFGPVNVLLNMLRVLGTRELARLRTRNQVLVAARLISIAGVAVAAVALVGILLVPDSLWKYVFGASWIYASPLILLMGLQRMAQAAGLGYFGGLRAEAIVAKTMSIRLLLAFLTLSLGLAGLLFVGAAGAVAGMTIAAGVASLGFYLLLSGSARDLPATSRGSDLGVV